MKKHLYFLCCLSALTISSACNKAIPAASSIAPASSTEESSQADASSTPDVSSSIPEERANFITLLQNFDAKVSADSFVFPKTFTESAVEGSADSVFLRQLDISSDAYFAHTSTTVGNAITNEAYAYIKVENGAYVVYNVTVLNSTTPAFNKTYTSASYTTPAEAQTALAALDGAYSTANTHYLKYGNTKHVYSVVSRIFQNQMNSVSSESYSGSLTTGSLDGQAIYTNNFTYGQTKAQSQVRIVAENFLLKTLVNRSNVNKPFDFTFTYDAFTETTPDLTTYTKK